MEIQESTLVQHVKAEIERSNNQPSIGSVNMDNMPPAERRQRIDAIEREAMRIRQLDFNLALAQELQILKTIVLDLNINSSASNFDEDSESYDQTMIMTDMTDNRYKMLGDDSRFFDAGEMEVTEATPTVLVTEEPDEVTEDKKVSILHKMINTPFRIFVIVLAILTVLAAIIAYLPSEHKTWIFPLLNWLGT